MSLFARRDGQDISGWLIPQRRSSRAGSVDVSADSAVDTSVVWAALRLRADLVSTMPLDLFRRLGSDQVEVAKPPVLVDPQGDGSGMREWLYSTQFDLDRVGNAYGIITRVDGAGRPAEIQLQDHKSVTVLVDKKSGVVTYRIGSTTYARDQIWHERQFTVPGMVMGLSPVAHAAWEIGSYQSAQQFALEWFANGGQIPGGHFKNTMKQLDAAEADAIKTRYRLAVENRDVLVTGKDWEYSTIDAAASDSRFLEAQGRSEIALTRYFGVPASAIDVNAAGQSITYANLSQDNLRLLTLNLQPTITRREDALSRLVEDAKFVKFNTGSFLRMDPSLAAMVIGLELENRTILPSEARALSNRRPLTDKDWAEFDRLPAKNTIGASA